MSSRLIMEGHCTCSTNSLAGVGGWGWGRFKGNPWWRCKLAQRCRKCVDISIGMHCVVVLSIFLQQKYFLTSVFSFSGCSHDGSLFTNERQKKPIGSWCIVHFCHTYQLCSWHHRLLEEKKKKIAVLTALSFFIIFIFRAQFLTKETMNWLKNCFESVCFPSIGLIMLLDLRTLGPCRGRAY